MKLSISIVCPIYNEELNIYKLCKKINTYLLNKIEFDLIFVDDSSNDNSKMEIENCQKKFKYPIVMLSNERRLGISACIDRGIKYSLKNIIITIDGDLQNNPKDINALLDCYIKNNSNFNLGIVIGQRVNRKDKLVKKITSKIGYFVRKFFFKDKIKDVACGLRLIVKSAYLEIPYFDNMHRYYSVLFTRHRFIVMGVEISHFKRKYGKSKFGVFNRLLPGIFDVFGVLWLMNRKRK